jgi:integrase
VSIERVDRASGPVWRVRWRDDRGRNRSKVLGRKRDAEAFDAEVRRLKRTRELGKLDAGKQTLADFGDEWWRLYADPNLARKTLELYAMLWDAHVLPRLGDLALRDLTPETIQRFQVELQADGVGVVSIRKALTLLHGVLQRACEWGRIPSNPAAAIRKPPARGKRAVTRLPPTIVERIRGVLLADGRLRDATLISVLAYAGLRPGEALALTWGHVRNRTLLVEAAVSLGELRDTKTGQRRAVALLGPLAQDLSEWRLACGRPPDEELVFPDRRGRFWTADAYRNWRRRIYVPAAVACGVTNPRPYDLRHSFVSLLIHEGRSVVEVARQAGHSPKMALDTYAHVFDEFALEDRLPAEEQIRRARTAEDVPVSYLDESAEETQSANRPQTDDGRYWTRTSDPLLVRQVL